LTLGGRCFYNSHHHTLELPIVRAFTWRSQFERTV
jgi:hypothetical protein